MKGKKLGYDARGVLHALGVRRDGASVVDVAMETFLGAVLKVAAAFIFVKVGLELVGIQPTGWQEVWLIVALAITLDCLGGYTRKGDE